jgi:hypothetical protein
LFWAAAAPAALASTVRAAAQTQTQGIQQQQDRSVPPADRIMNHRSDENSPPAPDPTVVLKANDKDMKQNVAKLAELAEDLKKEVTNTDSANVLSLELVHKAEEIEKLARRIASLARGA